MNGEKKSTALAQWLGSRHRAWKRLEEVLQRQKGARDTTAEEALEVVEGYRALARDLSLARQTQPDSRVTRYLESLLAAGYDALYRSPQNLRQRLVTLFRDDIPRDVKALRGPIAASLTIFVAGLLIGYWLVFTYPELITLFASEEMVSHVQQGRLWTDGLLNIMPSSLLSVSIMTNNIMVTLFAFSLGAFYGVGTFYIIALNGLMLGAVFAFTADYGLDGRLLQFVVAHGMVELSIIILAGAAGIRLGEALARPGQMTRTEAFRQAVSQAGRLVAVGAPFLVGAGLIEGYVSPNPDYDMATRVTIGAGYWLFLALVLSGRLWPRRRLADVTSVP